MSTFLVRSIACIAFLAAALTGMDAAALTLTGVTSRKSQGATGTHDLTIDTTQAIGGPVTVEPRAIGSGHTIVFQFDTTITATGTVTVVDGFGAIGSATPAITGAGNTPPNNEVSVTLTGIPDNKRIAISLSQVNGVLDVPAVLIGFLTGDVNNSRSVNSADLIQVKARAGQTAATGSVYDLNNTGLIGASDISAVKSRAGRVLTLPSEVELTMSKSGTGSGTVTSTPAGINCPAVCAMNLAQNTSVTVSAVATAGSTFNGWSGVCGGVATSSTFTVTANANCVAAFTINTYAVSPSAGANGSISPSGVQTINHGATATFTVTPNSGFVASVGGTCGGTLVWGRPTPRPRSRRPVRWRQHSWRVSHR